MLPVDDVVRDHRPYPIVTLGLVLLNVAVFLYELSLSDLALRRFIATWGVVPADLTLPGAGDGQSALAFATILTSMFIHAGYLHIAGNMVFLWVFGDNVEGALGHATYFLFYLLAGILGSLTLVAIMPDSQVPGIGASGAIAGVLGAYLLLFPHARVRTLLFLGPFIALGWVTAVVLIGLWFVLQVGQGLLSFGTPAGQAGGVAFFVHVGGFLAGMAMTFVLRRERREPIAAPSPLHGFLWTETFRNWVLAAGLLLLALELASLASAAAPALGEALRSAATLAAAGFATVDGVRRLRGQRSFLGAGHGLPRLLAIVQLLLSVGLLLAVFGV